MYSKSIFPLFSSDNSPYRLPNHFMYVEVMNVAECQWILVQDEYPQGATYTESQTPVSQVIDDVFTVRDGTGTH